MKLVLLGAPGAGKGTQARFISRHYGIPHISTGDLLRDNMKRQTELGKQISQLVESGKLVPDELVTGVLKERLEQPDCEKGYLLDGYPRTLAQAEIVEEISGGMDKVVSIHVEDSVIIDRMSGRMTCESCGAIFHLRDRPPKTENVCDFCGGKLIQRDDDKADTVKKRLDIYHKESEPIKGYFDNLGKLVVVPATKEFEELTEMIIAEIEK